jgi:hypothetical protein
MKLIRWNAGHTMVEMVVALGVMSMIFSIMATLTFVTARNSSNIHQQVISQTSAASASQRVSTNIRNARAFMRYPADGNSGPYTRLLALFPHQGYNTVTTETVALWTDGTRREIRYFDRELAISDYISVPSKTHEGVTVNILSPTPTPTLRFRNIANFELFWQSEYRVTMQVSYRYKGFAFQFSHPEYDPEGLFVTDCIAKNHFMDQGVDDYAAADTTSSPATL